jgi:hypothetical protein
MSDEEDSRLMELGQTILDHHFAGITDPLAFSGTEPPSNSVFPHTVQLSALLKSLRITSTDGNTLSSANLQSILRRVQMVIDDLEIIGQGPSPEIGPSSSVSEAYRVVCFSLLAISQASGAESRSVSQAPADPSISRLLSYLQTEFDIEGESPSDILADLKRKRGHDADSGSSRGRSSIELLKQEKEELAAQLRTSQNITDDLNAKLQSLQRRSDSSPGANAFVLEADLQAANSRCKELEQRRSAAHKKLRAFEQQLSELRDADRRKDDQISALKIEIDNLVREKDDLLTQSSLPKLQVDTAEIELKDQEIQKLLRATEVLRGQIDLLTKDLASESDHKAQLLALLEKNSRALQFAESKLRDLSREKQQWSDHLLASASQTPADTESTRNSDILSQISDFVRREFAGADFLPDCLSVFEHTPDVPSAVQRLLQTVAAAAQQTVENSELNDQNERLGVYVANLSHFIDQIANSREIQSWLLDSASADDVQSLLLAQWSRIDSFIRENGLEVDSSAVLPNFTDLPAGQLGQFAALSLANDVLRKYAAHLAYENQRLASDVQELRHEISQSRSEFSDEIDCLTAANTAERCKDRERIADLEALLAKGDAVEDKALAAKLRSVTADRDRIAAENADLRASLTELEISAEDAARENRELSDRISDLDGSLSATASGSEELQAEIGKLASQNRSLQKLVESKNDELKKASEDAMETVAQCNRELERRDREAAEANAKLAEVPRQTEELRREFARELRSHLQKSAGELAQERAKRGELEAHHEATVCDLRAKLADLRERVAQAESAVGESEARGKAARTALKAANVDLQMAQMRVTALEEKGRREAALCETKLRMRVLSVENQCQQAIDEQALAAEKRENEFMVQICEKLHDFVDFSAPLSEEAVQHIIDNVLQSYKQLEADLRVRQGFADEIAGIRGVLGVPEGVSVKESVKELVDKVRERPQGRRVREPGDVDRSWEDWAKRIHGLVTDNFGTAKTGRELQFALEETLMGSIGQRKANRRLEILRAEKQLLLSGAVIRFGQGRGCPSFPSLICVVITMRRLRKLAGHLPCAMGSPAGVAEKPKVQQRRFPILNCAKV